MQAFGQRAAGNQWLSREISEPDLYTRTRSLVDLSSGFLIMPGKAGTLAEVSFLWALNRAGLLGQRPVVLCGAAWTDLLGLLDTAGILDPDTLSTTWQSDAVDGAIDLLLEKLS